MRKYRLYLGLNRQDGTAIDRNQALLWLNAQLSIRDIKGASFFNGVGLWDGEMEPCLVLEVIADLALRPLKTIAQLYKHEYYQSCVLITAENTESIII